MPPVTNTASLQITTRQTGRSACVVRASAEESKLWLPKSEVKCVHAMRNAHGARADRARAVSGARRGNVDGFSIDFAISDIREFLSSEGRSSSGPRDDTDDATRRDDSNPRAVRAVLRRIV